jgi:Effector-associated domain 10
MPIPDELKTILNRIEAGNHAIEDVATLRRLLSIGNDQLVQQLDGKYNINIGQGQNIQIGDRIYVSWNDEAIQALIQAVRANQHVETKVSIVFLSPA